MSLIWTTTDTFEEAIRKAEENGHQFENDPTHGLSRVRRVTCVRCGNALLQGSSHVYGSAGAAGCEGRKRWA